MSVGIYILTLIFGIGLIVPMGTVVAATDVPQYIIFMVPDGMGLSNVTAARIYKYGPNGAALNFENLPYIGYQRTHSKNSTVTDSAAAGSAWASGQKFNNGEISCLDDNGDGVCDGTRTNAKTILEIAAEAGLKTGLVATSDITHATPAVFAAHVHNRKCESTIFEHMLNLGVDVLLGGGVATNRSSCKLDATDDAYNENLVQQAQQTHGYTYVTNKSDLATQAASATKLLGLFKKGGLTPIYQRSSSSTEPTLDDMTKAALDVLEECSKGFFLMVEGSQIDWANHARNVMYQIKETLDFDDSVKTVVDWIHASETRKKNTLLVVVADHETGGFIIDGPYGTLSNSGDTTTQLMDNTGNAVVDNDGGAVMSPDLTVYFGSNAAEYTSSANHTAVDTVIWSNNEQCAMAMDNTYLFTVMKNFLNEGTGVNSGSSSYPVITGFSSDIGGSVKVGTTVTFTATTATFAGDVYYRFDLIPNYGKGRYNGDTNWKTIQDFSTSSTCSYTFNEPGNFVVTVTASPDKSVPAGAKPLFGGSVCVTE